MSEFQARFPTLYPWIFVGFAGLLEIGWAVSLKKTEGFTRIGPMIGYAFFGLSAAFCLSRGMKGLPLAVAYAAWQGIALVGTAFYDAWFMKHGFSPARVTGLVLILAGIASLKLSNSEQVEP